MNEMEAEDSARTKSWVWGALATILFLVRATWWHHEKCEWSQGREVAKRLWNILTSCSTGRVASCSVESSPSGSLSGLLSLSFLYCELIKLCLARGLGCLAKSFWFGFICFCLVFSFVMLFLWNRMSVLPRLEWKTGSEVGLVHKKKCVALFLILKYKTRVSQHFILHIRSYYYPHWTSEWAKPRKLC